MATVVKSARADFDASTGMIAGQISGKRCGEDIPSPVTPCHIRADGLIWRASGAAADANARISGWSTKKAKKGQALTLWSAPVVAKYADETLVPGNILYLGANGALDTAPTVGDAVGTAECIDASNIRITRFI